MTPIEKDKLEALCNKYGLSELGISKGIYMADDNSGITINLRGDVPLVGITIAGTLHTEGHGNRKVHDIQAEINNIMKSKKSRSPVSEQVQSAVVTPQTKDAIFPKLGTGDTPAKGTTTGTCSACSCKISGTLDEFTKIQDKFGTIYCLLCIENADGKPQPVKPSEPKQDVKPGIPSTPVKPVVIRACKTCGIELSGARALECYQKDKPFTCEECESTQEEAAPIKPLPTTPARQPDARIPVQAYTPQGSIIKGFQPSLKEIGKIKIGGKGEERQKAGGGTFRIPVKFDHFEIVSLMRDEKGDFVRDPVMDSLGEKPQSLDIMLLFNDPTLNFVTRYNQYQGGKCLCQGDGVAARLVDGAQVECNPDTCPQFTSKPPKCKPNGILSVILTKSPRLGGVYKFRTTSFNSIRSILSSMFFLSNLTGGVLAMIPLKLTVSPMQVQPKDSAKPQTIYVVNLEFAGTAPELLQKTFEVQKYQSAMRENIIKLESTARAVLTAPESKEEIKEIEAEFYHEQQKEATK